jgi:hypothetical protein
LWNMQNQTITLTLPKPHAGRTMGGQARILREMRRFNVLDCGRRWGKTDLGEIVIHQPLLAGYPVGWFAPTYKFLDEAWTEISRVYAPVIKSSNKTEKRIELITGGILEGWTLDKEGAARGRKYKRIIIDEAARVKNLVDIFNYDIRPTLIDLEGDGFFLSTPKGLNDFFLLWEGVPDKPDWMRWQMPTRENPTLPLSEVEAMYTAIPERVSRQELDAEFLADGSFFQNVDACCVIEQPDLPTQHAGHRVVAGLDWALSEDFTRLTFFCVDCARVVDWWGGNRMDYTMQREFIKDRMNTWGNPSLLPERNSIGTPNIEMMIQDGMNIAHGPDGAPGFNTTASTKSPLIMALALGLDKKELKAPKEYAGELRSYEVEITTTNPKFSAPDGQHDDRVISLALAWWQVARGLDPTKLVDSI